MPTTQTRAQSTTRHKSVVMGCDSVLKVSNIRRNDDDTIVIDGMAN